MNTNNLTTLSWCQLMSSDIVGEDILVEYAVTDPLYRTVAAIIDRRVKVVGTDHIGFEHVLLVFDPDDDDIYIIKRDGQGIDWDAYRFLNKEGSTNENS